MQEGFKKSDIEILVATMNRNSLDFLIPMFPFANFSQFNILVINQTTQGRTLESHYPSVRVINSFEKGLSRSRNLALENALGKLILLTDDDVVFVTGFTDTILNKFNKNLGVAAIQFCVEDMNGNIFKKYPGYPYILNRLRILSTMSIELVYNRHIILESKVKFDEKFGLGAIFPLGEEHIFLNDLKNMELSILHQNEVVVRHAPEKNSDNITRKQRFEIIGAYYRRMFSNTSYFWLMLLFLFNLKEGRLKIHQIAGSYIDAIRGKTKYLKLIK